MRSNLDLNLYKLVVCDIDNTILCEDHPISDLTKHAVNMVRQKGLRFTLASGRNLGAARIFAEELQIDMPMILSNGCVVQDLEGNVLQRKVMPPDITKQIIEATDTLGVRLVLFADEKIFWKRGMKQENPENWKWDFERIEIRDWHQEFKQIEFVNKCVINDLDHPEGITQLERIYEEKFRDALILYKMGPNRIEFSPRGVTKADGLAFLAEHLGIALDEVIAIGDFDNDLEMICSAGLGLAVDNAVEDVKKQADVVIGSCAEDGPAKFLIQLAENQNLGILSRS